VQIYNFITDNPGTNFRGICSALTLPVGVVQYHLAVLTKGGLVSSRRDGRNKRYFEFKKFSDVESWMISVLRHETVKKILDILHCEGSECHGRLAQRLDISSQALTWHMNHLKEQGIVTGKADGLTVNYMIAEEYSDVIANCINILGNEK
jgi:predicted transcriptional regulator